MIKTFFFQKSWLILINFLLSLSPRSHRHFDKDKTGFLDHKEFKSCLRSLGYDLPVVEDGEDDAEFEAILKTVDPNGLVLILILNILVGEI